MIHNLYSTVFLIVMALVTVGVFTIISYNTLKIRRDFRKYFGVSYKSGRANRIEMMNVVKHKLLELWVLATQAERAEDKDSDEIGNLVTSIPDELLLFVDKTREHVKFKQNTVARIDDFNHARAVAFEMGFDEEVRVYTVKVATRRVQTY